MIMQSSSAVQLPERLTERTATLVTIDITRCGHLLAQLEDGADRVLFLDDFYSLATHHIEAAGGEVLKHMGDSVFALFEEDRCLEAITALSEMLAEFPAICSKRGLTPTDLRSSVHVGDVIVGGFGPNGYRDALGKASGIVFAMEGPGITVSEQVYRKLPSSARGPWKKRGGRVSYHMG